MIGIPLGLPAEVPFWGPILELVQPPLMFGGLALGIFRYRLYDVDRLLNRTLVYGLLTASLAAGYAAGVLVLGRLVGGGRRQPGRGRRLPAAAPRHPAGRRPALQPARR
jgi:hypothetical protein